MKGLAKHPRTIRPTRTAILVCVTALLAAPVAATAHHSGGGPGPHLLGVQQNFELVGELAPTMPGAIADDQIADLAVHKGFAYLNSGVAATCAQAGTSVIDINNPAQPAEVGFIPALANAVHREGAQALAIATPQFTGDLLAVSNQKCLFGASGGFDLYNVTNPSSPQILVQGAGDRSPESSLVQGAQPSNAYQSIFVWQDGSQAFLVGTDLEEFSDIDIYNITDPTQPQLIADINPKVPPFADIIGSSARGNNHFSVDAVVKRVGAQMRMLVSYQDAGYVQFDVTNPASPTLITDTAFDDIDPLTGFEPPEGNAHQAEYSHDGQFFLGADEDVQAFRLRTTITQAPFSGLDLNFALSAAEPIEDGATLAGDTVSVGTACAPVAAPPAGVTIAVAERGTCTFQVKADAIDDAGYAMAVVFNDSFGTGGGRCESLINMLIDPATVDIPAIFVGRANGLRILNSFDAGTYQCTGAAAETPADTDAPAVGTPGLTMEVASEFDGWGYAHLYDAQTSNELDAFAIPEGLNENFSENFGQISIHEFATDPSVNLAYAAYKSGGVRAFTFDATSGLTQTGAWIDPIGSNISGIERFTNAQGHRLVAVSDSDFGLQILRYTGPPAVAPPADPPSEPPSDPPAQPPATPGGDTDPPETTITKEPKKKTEGRKAKFRFSSDEATATFECKLDKQAFKACTSPYKKRVRPGKHKFKVQATDAAGNLDPTPATYSWKVKR